MATPRVNIEPVKTGKGTVYQLDYRVDENAKAESFMKTLKTEEVSISEYETFVEAKEQIDRFIDIVYNKKCLHSALDCRTPAEFEAEYFPKPFT